MKKTPWIVALTNGKTITIMSEKNPCNHPSLQGRVVYVSQKVKV